MYSIHWSSSKLTKLSKWWRNNSLIISITCYLMGDFWWLILHVCLKSKKFWWTSNLHYFNCYYKWFSHFYSTLHPVRAIIIVCLDTSWSMAGPRENLAKAVVLECSKQGKSISWGFSDFFDRSLWCDVMWCDVMWCGVVWSVVCWYGWWKISYLVSLYRLGGVTLKYFQPTSPVSPFSFEDSFAFFILFFHWPSNCISTSI